MDDFHFNWQALQAVDVLFDYPYQSVDSLMEVFEARRISIPEEELRGVLDHFPMFLKAPRRWLVYRDEFVTWVRQLPDSSTLSDTVLTVARLGNALIARPFLTSKELAKGSGGHLSPDEVGELMEGVDFFFQEPRLWYLDGSAVNVWLVERQVAMRSFYAPLAANLGIDPDDPDAFEQAVGEMRRRADVVLKRE